MGILDKIIMTSLKHSFVESFVSKGKDMLSCCDKIADNLLEHGANLYLCRHTVFPTLYAVGIKREEMYQVLLMRLVYFANFFFLIFTMIHTGNVGYCKQISCEFIVALTPLTLSSGWHRAPLIRLFNTSSVLVDRKCTVDRKCAESCCWSHC